MIYRDLNLMKSNIKENRVLWTEIEKKRLSVVGLVDVVCEIFLFNLSVFTYKTDTRTLVWMPLYWHSSKRNKHDARFPSTQLLVHFMEV